MRTAIILAIALGLAACGETASERQARDELERIERERDAAAAADVFSGVTPSADADDAPDADESVPGQDASCAGMADAEAFVRCLYAGIGEGWLNTREAPDGPAVFTDRTWTMGEEMRAAAPNWVCAMRRPRFGCARCGSSRPAPARPWPKSNCPEPGTSGRALIWCWKTALGRSPRSVTPCSGP